MRKKVENVARKEGFHQVCVWPATLVEEGQEEEFEGFMADNFGGTRVQFLETILTKPDKGRNGKEISGTGGRSDVFFAVNDEDVGKFAIPRLEYGIRWIEDTLGNGHGTLYPTRVKKYKN